MAEKHKLVMFDDELSERQKVIEDILGTEYDLIGIYYFTRESLDSGEPGVFVPREIVVAQQPIAIITDLILLPAESDDWRWGTKLLRHLYQDAAQIHQESDLTRSVVVASTAAPTRKGAPKGLEKELDSLSLGFRLKLDYFYWNDLAGNKGDARGHFRNVIRKAAERLAPEPSVTWWV